MNTMNCEMQRMFGTAETRWDSRIGEGYEGYEDVSVTYGRSNVFTGSWGWQ